MSTILESDLNNQQKEVVSLCTNWWETDQKPTFEISGPAGSGKTTIVEIICQKIGLEKDEVLFMAYVGKAAMMLTLKGNNAKTVHATLYDSVQIPMFDETGAPVMKNGRQATYRGFAKKKFLSPRIKLLVVDEGSMINSAFKADILSFGIPVIVLGDLNQLPPVFGDPAFLLKPDYVITEIMRQAKDNPIIKLSQMAIKGEEIALGQYGARCVVFPQTELTTEYMRLSDIIICGRNNTRQNIIDHYRRDILGIKDLNTLRLGEKVICRQNNWNTQLPEGISLTNGLIGYVDRVDLETHTKRKVNIDFRPEFKTSDIFTDIPMDYKYLYTPIAESNGSPMSSFNKFQFAYAITAHLAQGSQYENVLIYDERVGDATYYNKWLYTAITRAVSGLAIAKQPIIKKKKHSIFFPAA